MYTLYNPLTELCLRAIRSSLRAAIQEESGVAVLPICDIGQYHGS